MFSFQLFDQIHREQYYSCEFDTHRRRDSTRQMMSASAVCIGHESHIAYLQLTLRRQDDADTIISRRFAVASSSSLVTLNSSSCWNRTSLQRQQLIFWKTTAQHAAAIAFVYAHVHRACDESSILPTDRVHCRVLPLCAWLCLALSARCADGFPNGN